MSVDQTQERSGLKRWWAHSSALAKVVVFSVLAVVVLVIVGEAVGSSSSVDPTIKAHYTQWRAECEDRATEEVHASDGLYTVGGNHWTDLVNSCLTTKANDQP